MSLLKSSGISLRPRKVLITGATGFVGANLARHLLEAGHQVVVLLRPGFKARLADCKNEESLAQVKRRVDSWKNQAELIEVDVLDAASIQEVLLRVKPEWIFNLAAHGAYSWQINPLEIVASNVTALANLLDESSKIGFEAFVNAGSSSEYGFTDHAPIESEQPRPNSLYAVTKMAGTNLCGVIARRNNLLVTTLRLYSVYGPFEEQKRLIPTLIDCGLKGVLPPLVDRTIARDFIYIDDVVRAFVLATQSKLEEFGGVFNIGSGVQTTMEDVVKTACRVMSIDSTPDWNSMADRNWDSSIWVSNCEKAVKNLQWSPDTNFEDGLKKTIAWTLENSKQPTTF